MKKEVTAIDQQQPSNGLREREVLQSAPNDYSSIHKKRKFPNKLATLNANSTTFNLTGIPQY